MTVSRDVRLNVIAETRRYQQEMAKIPGITQKQAAQAARRWEKELSAAAVASSKAQVKAAAESAKAWDDFGTILAANLSADAIKSAGSALFDYTAEIMAARMEQINLAEATGISLQTFAGIELAAERAVIPVDEITGSFEDFGEVLFDAANGGGRASEALELLGFTQADLNKGLKDTDGTLRDVIGRMVAVGNEGKRNAIAQQLFGDAGNRLNDILGDGTIEDYIAAAEELGLVLDEEAVANTKKWTNATAELQQVFRGTTNEMLDFFAVGQGIENFTLGFVFAKEFIEAFANETLDALGKQLQGIALILTGEFQEGLDVFSEGFDPTGGVLVDGINNATVAALRASFAFAENREAIKQAGGAAADTSKAIGDLSTNQERAGKEADKTRREEEKLAKARAKAAQEFIAAVDEVTAIAGAAASDRLSDLDRIAAEERSQIERLRELELVHGSAAATAIATAEVQQRAARETAEVFAEIEIELEELAVQFDELDAELKEKQRARNRRNIDAAMQGFRQLSGAASALLGIELAAAEEAGRATASRLDEEIRRREELATAIENAGSAEEVAALERDASILDSAVGRSERILEQQRQQTAKIFKAQQGLEIANIIMSGASASIAALGPPPVGAGPILGVALAATTAAATTAQVAVVASQAPPQFDAGFAPMTRGPDNFAATLRDGEGVTNQRLTESIGSQALQEGNQTGSLPGQSVNVSVNIGGRELGRAVVDEMNAGRELTQSMNSRTGRRVGVRPVYLTR